MYDLETIIIVLFTSTNWIETVWQIRNEKCVDRFPHKFGILVQESFKVCSLVMRRGRIVIPNELEFQALRKLEGSLFLTVVKYRIIVYSLKSILIA